MSRTIWMRWDWGEGITDYGQEEAKGDLSVRHESAASLRGKDRKAVVSRHVLALHPASPYRELVSNGPRTHEFLGLGDAVVDPDEWMAMQEIVWFDEDGEFTPEAWEQVKAMQARIDSRVLRAVRVAQMADLAVSFYSADLVPPLLPSGSWAGEIDRLQHSSPNRHERRKQAKLNR